MDQNSSYIHYLYIYLLFYVHIYWTDVAIINDMLLATLQCFGALGPVARDGRGPSAGVAKPVENHRGS